MPLSCRLAPSVSVAPLSLLAGNGLVLSWTRRRARMTGVWVGSAILSAPQNKVCSLHFCIIKAICNDNSKLKLLIQTEYSDEIIRFLEFYIWHTCLFFRHLRPCVKNQQSSWADPLFGHLHPKNPSHGFVSRHRQDQEREKRERSCEEWVIIHLFDMCKMILCCPMFIFYQIVIKSLFRPWLMCDHLN